MREALLEYLPMIAIGFGPAAVLMAFFFYVALRAPGGILSQEPSTGSTPARTADGDEDVTEHVPEEPDRDRTT